MIDVSKFNLALSVLLLGLLIVPSSHADIRFREFVIDDNFDAVAIYTCDIDGDEDEDVLAAGISRGIALWRNDGGYPVRWTKQTVDDDFYGACSVYAADIDGDGDIDILGAAWYANQIACWRNDGGDPVEWVRFPIETDFQHAHEIYAADLDGDGDIDILGASAGYNEIAYWRNDGGEPLSWTKYTIDSDCGGARSVFAADMDGDSDLDVLGGCFSSNEILWWRNDGGDPINWTEFIVSNYFAGAHKVLAFDMDNDNDEDILGAAYTAADIAWWRNCGGDPIEWSMQIIDENFFGALTLYPADFDNDGDIDVAGAGDIVDDIAWWRNDGGDPFEWAERTIDSFYEGAWPVYASDIDNDGDIDVLSGSNIIHRLSWWENDLFTDIEESQQSLPENPLLIHNYPNPFNSTTTIRYYLPEESEVVICIYDIIGHNVETLVTPSQPAGYHQMTWHARKYPSGIYFYGIRAGDYGQTGRMTLLK